MTLYTIGFIGVGHIGSQVARAVVKAGHPVVISNSRGPATLTDLVQDLGPQARAATAAAAAREGELVVVAIPLSGIDQLPVEPPAGKVVIATTNYNPQRDGHIAELDAGTATVAGLVQVHLPHSRVVRAFSHISAAEVTTDGEPEGTPNRRALAIAGDDTDAREWSSTCTTRSASIRLTSGVSTRAGGSIAVSPPSLSVRTPMSFARMSPEPNGRRDSQGRGHALYK
jgi:predicted dinucleotide-binding enzyme